MTTNSKSRVSSNISVVIPTYNGARYIQQAIESVFAQTAKPKEIVIVDDCSTDDTPEIVENISRSSPIPIRLLKLETNSGGPAHPMNVGIESSDAEFIALLDQDDIMNRSKIEYVSTAVTQSPDAGLVFGQLQRISEDGEFLPPREKFYDCFPDHETNLSPDEAVQSLRRNGYRCGGAGGTAIRKKAWEDLKGFDEQYSIVWDYNFAFRLALSDWSFAYVPEIFFLRRTHPERLTYADAGMRIRHEKKQMFRELLNHPNLSDAERKQMKAVLARILVKIARKEYGQRAYLSATKHYFSGFRASASTVPVMKTVLRKATEFAKKSLPIH